MKVLVVEDEYKIANSLKKGLEQENFTVDLAYDGLAGFDLASTEDYGVIILDLMLPEMEGMTICKELRKKKNQTPILILTAKSQLGDKVEGLNCGADDYLVKPFAFEELLARIKALLRRPQQRQNSKLKVKNLELDTDTYEVKKDRKRVNLSRKEYALLEYFMRNEGRVVSKENIVGHVWDYEADILPNTVEVFIGYLRKKLGKETIKTVRGFGYRI
jgi:two-component system, OmpR family, response regulator